MPGGDRNTFQQRYFLCTEYWGGGPIPSGGLSPDRDDEGPNDAIKDIDFTESNGSIEGSDATKRKGGAEGKKGHGVSRGGEHAGDGAKGPIFFYVSFVPVFLFS